MQTMLLLIDLQNEFFSPRGVLGRRHIAPEVAERAAAAADAHLAAGGQVVLVRSCYDRWAESPAPARQVEPIDAEAAEIAPKDTRLAGSHTGGSCCIRDSELAQFVSCIEQLTSRKGCHVIEKHWYSALVETELEALLRRLGCAAVQVGGVTSTTCVAASATDLRRRGFAVELRTDLSGASSFGTHCRALAGLRQRCGARLRCAADVRGACSEQAAADGFRVLQNVLPDELALSLFEQLRDSLPWAPMLHAGKPVSRLVATLADNPADGSVPVYRFPSDAEFQPDPWPETVRRVRDALEQLLGQKLNHAKAQLYESRAGYIGMHSDKTLDIARGSTIVNLSLGATRTMRLERKSDGLTDSIEMFHNSAVLFDTEKSNSLWRHGVPADKRASNELRDDELMHNGQRISIVFRLIATHRTKEGLFGQGAKCKTHEELLMRKCSNEKSIETKTSSIETKPQPSSSLASSSSIEEKDFFDDDASDLLNAFRIENQLGEDFSWQETYGKGFDAVDFSSLNTTNK